MLPGEKINRTEDRAVLHAALAKTAAIRRIIVDRQRCDAGSERRA